MWKMLRAIHGKAVDRDQVDRIHHGHPHEHGQGERCDERELAVHHALGLLLDELDEHLDERLETPRHAGCRAPRREIQRDQHEQTAQHGEEDGVEVQDVRIEQRALLRGREMLQMMGDVPGQTAVFSAALTCHQRYPHASPKDARTRCHKLRRDRPNASHDQ